jgi:Domain of unknown function (DUF4157)/Domain of unknown function (DUF4347)/Effector protein
VIVESPLPEEMKIPEHGREALMSMTLLQNVAKTSVPGMAAFTGLCLQRQCACGGSAGVAGECDSCDAKKLSLQRSSLNAEFASQESSRVPPIVDEVLRSRGQPLDAETRAFFEPRFGHDFSRVRVHTDARAAESAQSINALAYTVGGDLVFGVGQYAPETSAGRRLVAHELAHVIQQQETADVSVMIGHSGDVYEVEADRVAESVSQGGSVRVTAESGPRLSRSEEPERVWGGFKIRGDPDYVNVIRGELNRLKRTAAGAALLQEISDYTRPLLTSRIPIEPSSACGFLPPGIRFAAGGCNLRNDCPGSTSNWHEVPNMVYLYHEIVHAYVYYVAEKGTNPERECMVTGLGPYFRTMPHSENKLRCELGLPVRPCYGAECRLPAPTCGQTSSSDERTNVRATYAVMSDFSTGAASPQSPQFANPPGEVHEKPKPTPQDYVSQHTNMLGLNLNEEGLASDLYLLAWQSSNHYQFVLDVLKLLDAGDKVEVVEAFFTQLRDDSFIEDLARHDEGRHFLTAVVSYLPVQHSQRFRVEKIVKAGPQREVEEERTAALKQLEKEGKNLNLTMYTSYKGQDFVEHDMESIARHQKAAVQTEEIFPMESFEDIQTYLELIHQRTKAAAFVRELHLMGHGTEDMFGFGKYFYSSDKLREYPTGLNALYMADRGTVYLDGCNVAKGETGRRYLAQVGRIFFGDKKSGFIKGNTCEALDLLGVAETDCDPRTLRWPSDLSDYLSK